MKCFYPSLDYGDVLKSKSKQTDQLPVLKCMKKIQAFLFLTKFPWVNLDWLFIPNDLCILVLGDIIMNCCSCPSQFIHKLHYSSLRLWVVGSERHLVVQQENSKCHSNAGSLLSVFFDLCIWFSSTLTASPSFVPISCIFPLRPHSASLPVAHGQSVWITRGISRYSYLFCSHTQPSLQIMPL